MTELRLAAHIHSDYSDDCDWTLSRIGRQLRAMRYDGALICDHDRTMTDQKWGKLVERCTSISESGFFMIPGIEYQDPAHVIHLPVFGDIPFLGRSREVTEILEHAAAYKAVSVFAHPARQSAFRQFDETLCSQLTGIEVWNRKYDGVRPNAWAIRTAETYGLNRFVSLDYHGPRQLFPLAVYVDVEGPVTVGTVLEAIRSQGVRPKALGLDPDRYLQGTLGTLFATGERLRATVAPKVRRAEGIVRRR